MQRSPASDLTPDAILAASLDAARFAGTLARWGFVADAATVAGSAVLGLRLADDDLDASGSRAALSRPGGPDPAP